MDLLNEFESLAQKSDVDCDDVLSETNIKRWQTPFDLDRSSISDEYWAILQAEQSAIGHDKETYAFFLGKKDKTKARVQFQNQALRDPKAASPQVLKKRWLFKLILPLDTASKVQVAAKLARIPDVLRDEEDDTVASVEVDVLAKEAISSHLGPNTTAQFLPRRIPAAKALCDASIAPTLGLDTTLPQHRPAPTSTSTQNEVRQDTYPVAYFFYGTLAETGRLQRLLNLDVLQPLLLMPAIVRGGKLRIWGKYRALVDAGEKEVVDGCMYEVQSREHEDALRFYEGVEYEVVRCEILVKGKGKGERVKGLTFRFCGGEGALMG